MNAIAERRNFARFQLGFEMKVVSQEREGEEFEEKTTLEDISGEGALFQTQDPSRSFSGKSLTVSIHLPGTDEVKASMRGKARVVRIEPCSNAASSGEYV